MPTFSSRSIGHLATCDERLIQLMNEVIKHVDCTIICGHRDMEAQEQAYRDKKSMKRWPDSKHNSVPSRAVDVAPYFANNPPGEKIDWNNVAEFRYFAGFVMGIATQMGLKIRSGSDWNGDFDLDDQKLVDLPHVEIIGE
jgi:hypothetical protein